MKARKNTARGVAQTPGIQQSVAASWGPALAPCLLALLLYARTLGHGFIDLDDIMYVTENSHVLTGLSWEGVRWAFVGSVELVYWHPLTWLSLMLDSTLYGQWAGGFHLTNVLLHTVNTALAYSVLLAMTGRMWLAAFVAACFAVHPAHIESVAWVTERKDVLFLFFGLCAVRLYLSWARDRAVSTLAGVYACYAASLMSKPTLVVLPGLLLLLDFWPLGRVLRTEDGRWPSPGSVVRLALEKLPLLAMAVAMAVATILLMPKNLDPFAVEESTRYANAIVSLVKYAWLFLAPTNLAILYPFPGFVPPWQTALAVLGILSALACVLRANAAAPWLLVGAGWFVLGLLPTLVIPTYGVQVSMANRFSYFSYLGGFMVLGLTLEHLSARLAAGWERKALAGSCALVLAWYGGLSLVELPHWKDKYTIYERALAVGADHYVTHNNYGRLLNDRRDFTKAEKHLRRALEMQPDFPFALGNLGNQALALGRYEEALGLFRRSLELAPRSRFAKNDLYGIGLSLAQLGRLGEAEASYRKALELDPGYAMAHNDLGNIAMLRGNLREAEERYSKALELAPDYAIARENLSRVRARLAAGS